MWSWQRRVPICLEWNLRVSRADLKVLVSLDGRAVPLSLLLPANRHISVRLSLGYDAKALTQISEKTLV